MLFEEAKEGRAILSVKSLIFEGKGLSHLYLFFRKSPIFEWIKPCHNFVIPHFSSPLLSSYSPSKEKSPIISTN